MSLDSRRHALEQRHADIEKKLHAELTRAGVDEAKLADLKREKLKLKDEIHSLGLKEKAA